MIRSGPRDNSVSAVSYMNPDTISAAGKPPLYYLEILAKSTRQIIFAYDIAANHFIFLNPAFEKIWGRTRKSIMANPVSLLKNIHPEDKTYVQKIHQDLLQGELIPDFEFRITLRNGSERWLCLKPLLLEDEQVFIGSADDITGSKEYNNTLKKFSDKKNSILNILSHDLAGPLAMIQSLTKVLNEDLQSHTNQEVHRLVELIERSSRQGTQMLQEFLKQEFLESANTELIKRRVDLVGALKELLADYLQTPLKLGKTFSLEAGTDPIYVDLDDNKFMQVINNLISNALKFTPDGGKIAVRVEDKEGAVMIQVADTGVGIPAKYHASLFDKFTKARRPGIKGEPSVGLGMSIIKTIVEWHHGQIWFESQENKGTTFFIQIPKI